MNVVGSISIFLLAKLSTLTSPDKYPSLRARSAYRRLHDDKREAELAEVFSQKGGSVAEQLWGMRPAPTKKKDTLMLKEKLKH